MNKIFVALGNDRPQILVRLEDLVLQAIIGVLEGNSSEDVIDTLYSEIRSLDNDLGNNEEALNWFNLSRSFLPAPSTPPPTELPSTPMAGMLIQFNFNICSNKVTSNVKFFET